MARKSKIGWGTLSVEKVVNWADKDKGKNILSPRAKNRLRLPDRTAVYFTGYKRWSRILLVAVLLVAFSMSRQEFASAAQLMSPGFQGLSVPHLVEPQGNIYYVAPGGSDSNAGTFTQPWRTIQKAANTLVAGDTVYIREGTYAEVVIPSNSGLPGQYIVYAAYPGETVTMDGTGVSLPSGASGLINVWGKSYIKSFGVAPNKCKLFCFQWRYWNFCVEIKLHRD